MVVISTVAFPAITVIGGAQIIDMVLLVIDITKGIQTQTAECLVIAEVSTDKMIVCVLSGKG
jgi:selenocysteine-specific elongation factor